MGRSAKRRRLPNLPLFSSFSRALHLTRLTSAARARVSENSLASKAAAQSDDAGLKHPTKIKRVDSSFSSDNNDEEEHLLEKGAIVQADFGFFDPKPGDFHGVKLLLQNYLDEKPWDLSGFVDLILGQTTVGTVVKLDGNDEVEEDGDEEDLYAVISALNFGRYGGHQCIGELKEFLVGVCGDESVKTKLKVLLEQQASDVGLLVSQRFVNCPHQLVPPLYDALFDEVSWAIEDEPTKELRDSFCFKFYLLITRIYGNKHANQYNAKAGNDSDEPIIYLKAEDELFHEMSSFSYTFHLHSSPFVPHELKNYRAMGLVMVINASVIPKFRQNLKTLLAES
ncbi:protein BCCIP homolog isoform X1 [Dendrobium catenatum]|uniref:protein BCCIP homolog isoform X1 n=1 Tax=Dendrobium catenatum TaxID=906689 RepID=UPI0009F31E8A|nr:protein BCCIP homolog isoform X1 [Dendrobium catenatum]